MTHPRPTILWRVCWAEVTITAFRQSAGTELGDALCDLLTNLMHWADARGHNFNAALVRAEDHYRTQVAEEAL